ncbi:LuxR family transcriptional regulator [Paenibacillus rigui]|uniref:LuxR family transcriptional regulator n=1 Tax=Paenibacillus rigui TaxID=554312 RepID=A0A229UVW5_9BACL|nr:LuxR family transcriptional regulator [Paenibacillus rigui]OXM87582.1 LuxR family transcriptional regulator [Paenibacillus rigui]
MVLEFNGLTQREKQFFVGRENELQQFQQVMEEQAAIKHVRILHIYGTGGVGKSTLLRLFHGIAEEKGACFVRLDSRDFVHTEAGFSTALLKQLRAEGDGLHPDGLEDERECCIQSLTQLEREQRVVLALDTFEEMIDMEAWLRDRFVPWLPDGTIVLLAGRHPLKGPWLLSPAWRELIRQLPLQHLNREDCLKYASLCGIREEERMEYLWRRSKGHPLTLSVAVAAQSYGEETVITSGSDWFQEVASLWLKEVPDDELRAVVEAASVLRRFNQELLSFVMEKDVSLHVFERLKSLSFVQQSVKGWQLHDLMSEITSNQFRERAPGLFNRYKERSAVYYAEAVLASSGYKEMAWEVGELFRHADVRVLKALASASMDCTLYWESVTESSFADVMAYIEWRKGCNEGIHGIEIDTDTGEQFLIEYPVEALQYNFDGLDMDVLYDLAPESIKLLRDKEGRIHALAVIIPLHAQTVPWLEQDPIARPYLASLTSEEKTQLLVPRERPAGWFMRTMDFIDLMNPVARTHGVYLLYAYICTGGIFACSPFPSRITQRVYPELGLSVVEGATHTNYDGNTITHTYAIDTRGNKLRGFLEGLFRKAGLEWKQAVPAPAPDPKETRKTMLMKQFTSREQEVIQWVVSGCSNAEVAGKLFVSEVTVKKHLKSIYAKLGIRSRTQLASKIMVE